MNIWIYWKSIVVIDTKKNPLEMVSVVLKDSCDSLVGFVRTDQKGKFTIYMDAEKTGFKLSFSFVGYETKDIKLDEFKNNASIVMNEANFVLNEVKVTSKRIEQKSDTLIYSVAGFKQAQDRSIADVISKMPGLEAKNDGSIEYQGKKINKFYIEGMDLLGSKYSQASENLSANKVKSVQVLENHQPVKMLRNMQFSDRATLNFVLNDDAKNVWTGIIEIGSGTTLQEDYRWNREARLVAMLFGRH
ncbi:MAG: carboxypeptidase-like regulatory domain-containing protein [Bacteroidaceae bacterium]|nr:carboxypeptidase-like regulatory domain-containing protein [Bacteroidaceae bacterium]